MALNGIVLVNKERGVSSNKVVNKVKYLLKADKAGHLGTLDVLGEGLLPITLGKSTKLFDYYLHKDKVYQTTFKFGETTATLDLEGDITDKNDVIVSFDDLQEAIKSFIGKKNQMPPEYSAKKIGGRKAYELARQGEQVELKPKEIEIYSIRIIKEIDVNTFILEIHCSSGTYIRSLCRDIAAKLSTYGVMQNILRTKCGDFYIEDSFSIENIEKDNFKIVQPETLFDLKEIMLDDYLASRLLNGVIININEENGEYKIFHKQNFLGLGKVEKEKLKLTLRLI